MISSKSFPIPAVSAESVGKDLTFWLFILNFEKNISIFAVLKDQ
jgi:hypothetical protein